MGEVRRGRGINERGKDRRRLSAKPGSPALTETAVALICCDLDESPEGRTRFEPYIAPIYRGREKQG